LELTLSEHENLIDKLSTSILERDRNLLIDTAVLERENKLFMKFRQQEEEMTACRQNPIHGQWILQSIHQEQPKESWIHLLLPSTIHLGIDPISTLYLQMPRCTTPDFNADVKRLVILADKDWAATMTSMIAILKFSGNVFWICKNRTALGEKQRGTLRMAIMKDPKVLHIRSNGQQFKCPDGYTIFMAAVDANQIQALEIIWDCTHVIGGIQATMQLCVC
jgi:hypothetical protein